MKLFRLPRSRTKHTPNSGLKKDISTHYPCVSYKLGLPGSYRYSSIDTIPIFTVSSNFTKVPMEKHADVSLQPTGRPRGTPERQYSCDICGEKYAQRQGVFRHHRKAHNNPHSCLYCEFKWSRPDQYRTHLEKWHPDVDRDHILGKRAGSRRKSTIIGRDLLHPFPPQAIEPDKRSQAKPTYFFLQ